VSNLSGKSLASRFGIPLEEELLHFQFVKEKVRLVPYLFAKERLLLPLEEKGGEVVVAMHYPHDLEALEELRCLLGKKIREVYSSKKEIEEAIENVYHQHENEASQYFEDLKATPQETLLSQDVEDGYDLLEQKSDSPVIRMLNIMIVEAIQQGASDIHFEPLEEGMIVRYRIDGVLQFRHSPPREYQNQLITRIKVMARLDIAQHRLPQDGRIKLNMGGRQIDFRASTVPVVYGERIVLRILDKGNVLLGLDKIGMPRSSLDEFRKFISQNQGIVLVTGPTGSGKTTTLYSAISELNSSERNIMTIEDPVEYKLSGMAQIGVNPKIDLTFAKGLRHILRQDPDVILIGEIRDKETAEIAIQASLTGHLVLSTLHTNNAPSALTRLVEMGIEPYLLSSSVIAVVAQRLVRKICLSCKAPYHPTKEELLELGLPTDHKTPFYRGNGCGACFGTGYQGRHGVYELMSLSPPIKEQLLKSADSDKLQLIALENGMRSLDQEGVRLVCEEISSTEEVLRVTRRLNLPGG